MELDRILEKAPFFLDSEALAWVRETLGSMSEKEKISQLFCPLGVSTRKQDLLGLAEKGIGGIMFRPMKGVQSANTIKILQENSKIPMLIAGNLEMGGNGAASDGTMFGSAMQAAATNDLELASAIAKAICLEGKAIGINWAFAPVSDIDLNFRNPITNLRTFGSDPERVLAMSKAYVQAAQDCGLAATVKHFPGDGVDERDQHLLTSVNSLSCDEWTSSYGRVYEALIASGVKSFMVGHIAQPAWQARLGGETGKTVPASLSKELMQGLLREKLGFNGLIATDATPMAGFRIAMRRELAVPLCIENGADVFLFARDLESDFNLMLQGLEKGILSKKRLDDAVIRILGLKASLGLHLDGKALSQSSLSILGCPEHKRLAAQCADKAITLVKDTQGLLPVSPKKYPRVYLNVLEPNDSPNTRLKKKLMAKLRNMGFEPTLRDRRALAGLSVLADEGASIFAKAASLFRARNSLKELTGKPSDFTGNYDLALYVANFQPESENTVIRIDWKGFKGMGNDVPWFVSEIPTLFVSLGSPYHLQDVPMIKTYINAYGANDETIDLVFEKLAGLSKFSGTSPVDPSCGREDALF